MDTATDARIRQAFAREIPDTTKFIIAQRVSSVSGADRILVLDDGVISGFDTHENLLKTNPHLPGCLRIPDQRKRRL